LYLQRIALSHYALAHTTTTDATTAAASASASADTAPQQDSQEQAAPAVVEVRRTARALKRKASVDTDAAESSSVGTSDAVNAEGSTRGSKRATTAAARTAAAATKKSTAAQESKPVPARSAKGTHLHSSMVHYVVFSYSVPLVFVIQFCY
jgi:hypothetical protein